jgi:hypothetical protein
MRGYVRYAIRRNGEIVIRALPTRRAAENLLAAYGGKVIVDPRSLGR